MRVAVGHRYRHLRTCAPPLGRRSDGPVPNLPRNILRFLVAISVVILIIGLALLITGGDLFVSAAVRIARFLRMPPVVIGSTLVSLTTTTPELVVSVMAGAKGESGLALGNAVGSCICNVGLILGVTATLKHVDVHPLGLRMPLVAMFACGLLLLLFTLDLRLSRAQGIVLILAGLAYFIYDFTHHARDRKPADVAEAATIEKALTGRLAWFHSKAGTIVQFTLGATIVVIGSRLLVDSAVTISNAIGIPPVIVGLTVIAVGTSLPELITAVTSSRQNVSDLAVGNVLGANIANLTLIAGAAAVLSDVTMSRATQLFNFPAMLLIFALLLWMLLTGRRITRKEGVALLVFYNLYLAGLVLLTAALKQ
jgi:cation:H+ antiporter